MTAPNLPLTEAQLDKAKAELAMLVPHAMRRGDFDGNDRTLYLRDNVRRVFPIVSLDLVMQAIDMALALAAQVAEARREVLDEMFEALATLPMVEFDQEVVADHLRAHLATPEASDE